MKILKNKLIFCLLLGLGCGNNAAVPEQKQANVAPPPASASPAPRKADLDYLMGKFDPTANKDFETVGKPYTDRPGMYLRKEALASFKKMYDAAAKEGIKLKIISATRTFSQQKDIWEGKWTRFAKDAPESEARALKIMEYSAMPGTSRHHWGTDVDLNDLNNPAFEPGGRYAKLYEWLVKHAHEYNFCQPYTAKDAQRPEGYNEERWHWSYMPVSKPLLTEYLQVVNNEMISGFKGAETAVGIKAVERYAGGINKSCQ
ncbi:MAG: M15 family metallopeptidase [Bacteroidota bacterium]